MPYAFQAACRRSEAGRVGSRRLSRGAACNDVVRAVPEADHDALPEFSGDGNRGVPAFLSRGWFGADGRLRQDHAGAHHGRDVHESTFHLHARRTDAAGQLGRRDTGLGLGHLEVLGGAARRQHHRKRLAGNRARHRALTWTLHDDGHRLHHDQRRRGARLHAAGCGLDSGAGFASCLDGHPDGQAHRRDGVGGPQALRYPHRSRVPQRRDDGAGARRLDQCDRASDRDGAARGGESRSGRLRRARAQDPAARQHPALGQVSDGGLLLCGRFARAARQPERASRSQMRLPPTEKRWARTSPAPKSSTTM